MCGRFTISVSIDQLRDYLKSYYQIDIDESLFDVPRYNVSPGQDVIAIIFDGKKYRVGLLKWGYIAPFSQDEKRIMINAKAETIHQKVSFSHAFKHKRCLILADGFYEWVKNDKEKLPYRIIKKDATLFPMAGIYNTYTKSDGTKVHTTLIITTQSNELMKNIHDRMPVIIKENDIKNWFDPHSEHEKNINDLLNPYDPNFMEVYRVSKKVNDTTNDDDSLIQKI